MKILTLAICIWGLIAACNNDANGDMQKDTVQIDVSTQGNTDAGDTSSYDRMSNKVTDSTQQ